MRRKVLLVMEKALILARRVAKKALTLPLRACPSPAPPGLPVQSGRGLGIRYSGSHAPALLPLSCSPSPACGRGGWGVRAVLTSGGRGASAFSAAAPNTVPLSAARRQSLGRARPAWLGPACFVLAALLYGTVCVSILRQPLLWLLGYVADDAFYYLQIARHLATGQGTTFDGLNPTNGYHPGWMLLMTACARLVPGKAALLRAALGVAFACHLATSLVLVPTLRRLVGPNWAWVLASVWLLNSLPLTLALYGVESAFAQLTLAALVWAGLAQIAPFLGRGKDFLPPPRSLVVFGLSLTLAFYGRTDQILLAGLALLWLSVAVRVWTAPAQRLTAMKRTWGWVGITVLVGIAPWYLFSYVTCGTMAQDSGTMKMLWHAQSVGRWDVHSLILAPLKFVDFFWLAVPFHALLTGAYPASTSGALGTLLLLILWVGLVGRGLMRLSHADGEAQRASLQWQWLTLWLGSALLLSGLAYGALMNDPQFWYLAGPSLVLFLLPASGAVLLLRRFARGRVQEVAGALLLAGALSLCIGHRLRMTAPYPWQRDVFLSQPRVESLIPAQARIGCFDAGIPAYFSPRTVVNLDGLVNHTAVAYWKRRTLEQYLAAQHIQYLANEPGTLHHALLFMQSPPVLVPIARFPLRGWSTGARVLWRVGR